VLRLGSARSHSIEVNEEVSVCPMFKACTEHKPGLAVQTVCKRRHISDVPDAYTMHCSNFICRVGVAVNISLCKDILAAS